MTGEILYGLLGDINDKYIIEAIEYRRTKKLYGKWIGAVACLVLILIAVILLKSVPTTSIIVNRAEYTKQYLDLDGTSFVGLDENDFNSVKSDFYSALGIEYDEFTERLEDHFELVQFGAVYIPPKLDGSTKRTLHDYCFTYVSENGGQINIAMCAFDLPLRDIVISAYEHNDSKISDTILRIYGDEDNYIAEFSHKGVNYFINANRIDAGELETLLFDIIG